MKQVDATTKAVWASGDYTTDDRRPMARVTIQKMHITLSNYEVPRSRSVDWHHEGQVASALFGQQAQPRELHNVKSIKYDRSIETDVASCTIVLYNLTSRPDDGNVNDEELDLPGYYTPNRGTESFFNQWNYKSNTWKDWLLPDRLIKTYEGYGFDGTKPPELDPHMYPSGVWLIDDVELTTDGLITLTCRDLGRLLVDHIMFPPVVPWDVYPLWFSAYETKKRADHHGGTRWQYMKYDTDSNMRYVHQHITDNGEPVCDGNGSVLGHHGRQAFDDNPDTYWLSVGSEEASASGFRYVQGKLSTPGDVEGVHIDVRGGSYRMWVSLQKEDGTWVGRKSIPYQRGEGEVELNADIPYVASFQLERGRAQSFKLPQKYSGIKKIRITISDLWNSGIGYHFKYRAAIQTVRYASTVTSAASRWHDRFGNYNDYTDVVRWLLAWGGFHWPRLSSGQAFQTYSNGVEYEIAPNEDNIEIGNGTVWGDLQLTGTTGVVKLDVAFFDKKPLMDGIAAIRDIVGFEFHVDETGGAIWRMPNVWKRGNWLMPTSGGSPSRSSEIVTIHEEKTLTNMSAKMSSKNVRERVFIGNIAGHLGSVVRGYNPVPSGMRRVGGWTDQRFATNRECKTMADLIAMRQMWLYRQNQVTIPGNPQLQIDDQVMIVERLTGEGYLHRIMGISSTFDNEDGKWEYTLTTQWMGTKAFGEGAYDPEHLDASTRRYLKTLGVLG